MKRVITKAMVDNMVYVSIILPAYNEEKAIGAVISEILQDVHTDYEIIVVDDGSKDSTSKYVEDLKNGAVRLIKHPANKGKPEAIRTGVKNAKGCVIAIMDADHTYPAAHIDEAIKKINAGYDVVLGDRFAFKAHIKLLNKLGNFFFSMLISYYTSNNINDAQTGFRVFKKELFEKIDVPAKGLEYETKQTINALYNGYSITEIPITYRKRMGVSKLNRITDGYRMFCAISDVAYSTMSLQTRSFLIVSIMLFFAGSFFGFISLYEKISLGVLTHGYYPIISTMAIVLSFQTFSLGIILDSLGRKLDRIEKKCKLQRPE